MPEICRENGSEGLHRVFHELFRVLNHLLNLSCLFPLNAFASVCSKQ